MHICFICSEYPKIGFPHGGFGSFVKTIAQQLTLAGVKVSVIGVNYTNKDEHTIEDGISVYRIARKSCKGLTWLLNSVRLNRQLREIHRNLPITIIESSELGLAFIQKFPTVKYVIRLHGGHHFFAEAEKRGINFWKGFQEKRSFKKADGFIAVSNYVKMHTAQYLSYDGKNVEVIPLSMNLDLFTPLHVTVSLPYKIVFVGTVCEKKGVRELIRAFQKVKTEYSDAQLFLYGRDWTYPDGRSYIEQLQTDFSDAELQQVHFMGNVAHAELPSVYESATVCVFPSHMETQGLVAPEAMAMQKPVIFTNAGPGPETIIDGETGFLVDPLNPQDIADKILYCFRNPELTLEIGVKARAAAIAKFDSTEISNKNLKFYKSLLR